MKDTNIFFLKNYVDNIYPNEDVNSKSISEEVTKVKCLLEKFSDCEFIEILISCFIPDLYLGMGKKEKLYTKLSELIVGEWCRRMGGNYHLPSKKSGTEDVDIIFGNYCILCDAKIFRLGRSQKAPNVKDFLKLESVKTWIRNYQKTSNKIVVGGMIAYPSLFEWESNSEVYQECTTAETPVIMLSYEVMAILLKYKAQFNLQAFLDMWDYKQNSLKCSQSKENYTNYMLTHISQTLGITADLLKREINEYRAKILKAVDKYKELVTESIEHNKEKITKEISEFRSIDELKKFTAQKLIERENELANEYFDNIIKFRKY